MTTLSDTVRDDIAETMAAAEHGDRTATAGRLAEFYGVSPSTIYKIAKIGGTPRKREADHPEYRGWVKIAVVIRDRPWRQKGQAVPRKRRLPLDVAIRIGLESGELPKEAAGMPLSTAHRLVDEMNLKPTEKPGQRIEADYPMQALLIDYSTSENLVVDSPDGEDWILRLHDKPWSADGYKNKPLKPHRQRLGVYALWDICTGCTIARYVVGKGENALDAMKFLAWALGKNKDPRLVVQGLPDDLWSDQGPLAKSKVAAGWFDRLGIALITGAPYDKARMGGVEQSHRRRWDWELSLFYRDADTIRLSELNERLNEYTVERNGKSRSRTEVDGRSPSCADAWVALTNARPKDNPLQLFPDNAIETLAREAWRWIDSNGMVRWDNVHYEVEGWRNRWVIARQAIDRSGDLVLESADGRDKGERRTARRYVPRPYGAVRKFPPTELDKVHAEYADLKANADIHAPKPTADSNVRPMPARTAPAAELDNPLAADRMRDLDEAMRHFTSICPYPLSKGDRQKLVEWIEGSGLSRQAITEKAQEIASLKLKHG